MHLFPETVSLILGMIHRILFPVFIFYFLNLLSSSFSTQPLLWGNQLFKDRTAMVNPRHLPAGFIQGLAIIIVIDDVIIIVMMHLLILTFFVLLKLCFSLSPSLPLQSHFQLQLCPGADCPIVIKVQEPRARRVQCSRCSEVFW